MEAFVILIILVIFIFGYYFYEQNKYFIFIGFKTSFIIYNIIIVLVVTSFCYVKGREEAAKYIDNYQIAVEHLKSGTITDKDETILFTIDNELYGSLCIDKEYIKKICPNSNELYYFACYQKEYKLSPNSPMCKFYLDKIPDNYDGVLSKEILLEKNISRAEYLIDKNKKFLNNISQ